MKNLNNTRFIGRWSDEDSSNYKLLFYALLVGIVSGVVSSVFRLILTYAESLKTTVFKGELNQDWLGLFCLLMFTFVAIWFSMFLVKKFAPETAGSGIQEIEGALDGLRPIRWRRVLPIKFLASVFSLSSGLLLGREGPTVQIGANVGKMVKDIFHQSEEENNAMISSGAASGLASAFNAPFSGIIFVIEEMNGHFKFNFYSVSSLMIGAATADLVVRAMVGSGPVVEISIFTFEHLSSVWLFILLGIVLSVIGFAFNKLLIKTLDFAETFKVNYVKVAFVLALIIVVLGYFFPDAIGAGYKTIYSVTNKSFTLKFLLFLFVVRFILSIFSYGSGVSGGIFTPLITLGVISGMLFGGIVKYCFPDLVEDYAIFAVAGMAGIFASTIRAPLTGLALSVEMTANYNLILPLIFTAVTASVCTAMLGNTPIYMELLKRTLRYQKT
jgi:CIC family chloride channel protein